MKLYAQPPGKEHVFCQELWEKWGGHNYTILCSHPFAKFLEGTCLKKKSCLNNKKGRWNYQSHINVNAPASFYKCVCGQLLSLVWLCNTMHCRPPGSSVHRIFQARILEQVDISYSRGSSWPRDWTHPASPALVGRFFTAELPGKPLQVMSISQNKKATQQLTLLLFVARKYRDAGPTVIFTCKWAWKD